MEKEEKESITEPSSKEIDFEEIINQIRDCSCALIITDRYINKLGDFQSILFLYDSLTQSLVNSTLSKENLKIFSDYFLQISEICNKALEKMKSNKDGNQI